MQHSGPALHRDLPDSVLAQKMRLARRPPILRDMYCVYCLQALTVVILKRTERIPDKDIHNWTHPSEKKDMVAKCGDIGNLLHLEQSASGGSERLKLKLVDFDAEILRINCEALSSTSRMVAELEKMNEEGIMALSNLESQDEQLERLEANLLTISNDISDVKNDMNAIQRCCLPLLCCPIKRFRRTNEKGVNNQTVVASSSMVKHRASRKSNGVFMQKLTDGIIEDAIENNLRQVDETLESIKHLAIDINMQLFVQEPKVDRIQSLIENSGMALNGVNEKVNKLLLE